MQTEKKIAQTDAIFTYVHWVNEMADQTEGVIRISFDTKANVNVGPYSRGGYSRQAVKAADHDFGPEMVLKPFGIFLPAYNENYFYFTDSYVTADFMIDALEDLWPTIKARFNPHTIVINADNGPENNSHRSQFMKRLIEFVLKNQVSISLAYYPPYHSKYNPIERVWGVLEQHWNGTLLNSVDAVLRWSQTFTWKGNKPIVRQIKQAYERGVKLTCSAFRPFADRLQKAFTLPKWSVSISPQ
jgi:transposase